MNKEQLDAIKERVENATPGEWSMGFCYDRLLGTYLLYAGKDKCILSTHKNPSNQDAEFIAHARQDVPVLIAEVERLQQFERKAIYAIEENRKLREAITQALEVVSDVEGELIERVERVLLDALEGADNDGA